MSLPKIAYISGRVSGVPIELAANSFSKKAIELRAQGFRVKNPIDRIIQINMKRREEDLPVWTDKTHRKEILGVCLFDLSQSDEIHMLPNWQISEGACIEHDFAELVGMKIVYHLQ